MKNPFKQLVRNLGLADVVGVGLGAIIGAGVFVVTGVAVDISSPVFLIGLFIAGSIATCNVLSFAQLAAQFTYACGTYDYGNRLLSPLVFAFTGYVRIATLSEEVKDPKSNHYYYCYYSDTLRAVFSNWNRCHRF